MNTLSLTATAYTEQLTEKLTKLQQQLIPFTDMQAEVFSSPLQNFRMRAEFRIWHEGDDLYHIMFDPVSKQRQVITAFPIASTIINQAMGLILNHIKFNTILRRNLFQIDYLSTLSGQLLISLIYHRQLDDVWLTEAQHLKQYLIESGLSVNIIGRAHKQKYLLEVDYVDEVLSVHGKTLYYRQVENAFSQPNASINIKMLEWLHKNTRHSQGDLLELYCGNGNFSLALADNFEKVLATEISKSSVAIAQHNILRNQINNVKIIRLSDIEFTAALEGQRTFNRLKEIDLASYQCHTILVDPPRSGLPDATLNLVQRYPTILYISCNPVTLCENLAVLTETHDITALAAFDQFPYTPHLECGVILKRKSTLTKLMA